MEDRCLCCGRIIPEGRMVCPLCERESNAKWEQFLEETLYYHEPNRPAGIPVVMSILFSILVFLTLIVFFLTLFLVKYFH